MKIKLWSTYVLTILCLTNCKGQDKEMSKEKLEQLITEEYQHVKQYPTTPIYSIQVNKQGCRVILEAYSEDYRFVENGGESMMVPFNYMITKSGEQKVKVRIYPKEGDSYITKYANVQIKIYNANEKDSSLKDYKILNEFNLPLGLEPQKLPYYEKVLTFIANVPFDYSKNLQEAKDLTKINNIKELAKNKYLSIQNIAKNNDAHNFIKEFMFSFGKTSNTTYQTLDELKSVYKNGVPYTIVSPLALEKDFFPLDDCEIQFYAGGKVIALWHKKSMTSGLDMKYKYKKEDGTKGESASDVPMFLYMPKGSDELKVW